MKGRKSLIWIMVLLLAAAGGYLGWRYVESLPPLSSAAPDTAAMAFLDALARGDQDAVAEMTTRSGPETDDAMVQAVFGGYSGELERIRSACGGLTPAGIISEVVAQTEDSAQVHATVTFECPGDAGVEFLDAELRLVRRDGAWAVAE